MQHDGEQVNVANHADPTGVWRRAWQEFYHKTWRTSGPCEKVWFCLVGACIIPFGACYFRYKDITAAAPPAQPAEENLAEEGAAADAEIDLDAIAAAEAINQPAPADLEEQQEGLSPHLDQPELELNVPVQNLFLPSAPGRAEIVPAQQARPEQLPNAGVRAGIRLRN